MMYGTRTLVVALCYLYETLMPNVALVVYEHVINFCVSYSRIPLLLLSIVYMVVWVLIIPMYRMMVCTTP